MIVKRRASNYWVPSALLSAAIHVAAVAVLFSKPLYLVPRLLTKIGKAPSIVLEEENITIFKQNRALEEAFASFDASSTLTPLPTAAIISANPLESIQEIPPFLPPIDLAIPDYTELPLPSLLISSLEEEHMSSIETPALHEVEMIMPAREIKPMSEMARDTYDLPLPSLAHSTSFSGNFDFIPSLETSRTVRLAIVEMPLITKIDQMSLDLGVLLFPEIPQEKMIVSIADFSVSPSVPKSISGVRLSSSIAEYGLPSMVLKEWNQFFDVDVKTYPQEEGGFLFSLQFIPKIDLSEYRLHQNYLFLIDRSHSIDQHRYLTAKRAILRAISALKPGDGFNIFILDHSVIKLNDTILPFTKAHVQKAETFLEKHSALHQGAASDIYGVLPKILDTAVSQDETVTAILISDGDSTSKSSQQRKKINQWLEANRDRITLYTATAGYGNNLSSLKMLSLASRGALLYSDTHAAFPRKLAKLVMDLRHPIAKEMTFSILSNDSNRLEVLPPSRRLPNLYSDHPYILIGLAEKLTDFTLLLEGKNKDQIFSIKKTIPLSKAKLGSRLLLKQWLSEKAHTLFDHYLQEGESTFLRQAEKQLGHDSQDSRR